MGVRHENVTWRLRRDGGEARLRIEGLKPLAGAFWVLLAICVACAYAVLIMMNEGASARWMILSLLALPPVIAMLAHWRTRRVLNGAILLRSETGELVRERGVRKLLLVDRVAAGPGAMVGIDSFMYQWPRGDWGEAGPRRSTLYRVMLVGEPADSEQGQALQEVHTALNDAWSERRGDPTSVAEGHPPVVGETVIAVVDSLELATALGSRVARGLDAPLVNATRAPSDTPEDVGTGPEVFGSTNGAAPGQRPSRGAVKNSIAQLGREHSSAKPGWVFRRVNPDGERLSSPEDFRWLWLVAVGGLLLFVDHSPLADKTYELGLLALAGLAVLGRWTRIELGASGVRVTPLFLGFRRARAVVLEWKDMYELNATDRGLTVQLRDDAVLVRLPRRGARWLARQLRRWLQRQAWVVQSTGRGKPSTD